MTNKRQMKVDEETHNKIMNISFELSDIEKKKVSMSEVLKRTFKAPDIPKRLKEGSMTRRKMK